MLITLTERRKKGGSGGGGMKTNSCIMLSKAYNWILISLSLLQPNIFIYHWWSCCWYFGICGLERICVLFTSHGIYFTWPRGQSKVLQAWIMVTCNFVFNFIAVVVVSPICAFALFNFSRLLGKWSLNILRDS